MKSAFELAMERLGGGPLRDYTPEQKEQLAEVDRIYDAKAAQAKLSADSRLGKAANDPEQEQQVRDDLVAELASINSQRERKKDELRKQFGQAQ